MPHAQEPLPSDDDLLTPEEVAKTWKTSPETVRRYCRQGKLTHSKVGSMYRIRRSDAAEYLARRTRKAS